jgi:3-oxoacyl-[acyl-carrier protein] reductase
MKSERADSGVGVCNYGLARVMPKLLYFISEDLLNRMNERKGRVLDRKAIVTGASRGIGKAISLLLAMEGAHVVVNYNKSEIEAHQILSEIDRMGSRAVAIQADVGKKAEVEKLIKEAIFEFGGVDILVNNAGVAMGGGLLQEFKDEEYDPMWNVNVKGILNCSRAVAPYMKEKRYGKIINLASVAGLGTANPGNMLYASTKAAVIILTKRLALELGQYNINVNAIAPGLIRTDMGLGDQSEEERRKRIGYFEEHSMLRRIGEPENIAHAALFLASEESSFMTAQVLSVDGGRTDFLTHSL